ncbi:hypothetical protein HIM_02773 [Hirsutella minnesotensis 3608]|nr:hypothetical protein HIM_02773 [Hirsutella minnesotensis 3608]
MSSSSDIQRLKTIPDHQARQVLLALCNDERVLKKAVEYARQLEEAAHFEPKSKSSLAVCVRCDEVFNTNDRDDEACEYHDGHLEVDDESDFWADHDEMCHGTIDTEEMRKEYPEGFIWTCCGEDGTSDGCLRAMHEADPGKASKGRY